MNRLPAIRVPSGRARRSARRPGPAAALFAGLVCALSVFPAGRAEVYHFIEFDPDRRDVRSWDPGVWGPGKTMYVPLVRSAAWEEWIERAGDRNEWYDDIEDIERVLEAALDAWANIPTADIRWELGGVISEEQARDEATFPMSIRLVPISNSLAPSLAEVLSAGSGTYTCGVNLVYHGEFKFFTTAVHELGHCLGLAHPDLPVVRRYDRSLNRDARAREYPIYWRFDPVMSYGRSGPSPDGLLTPDDAVGASLLRPRDGWLATTGSIVGRVTLPDGEGVPWAHVLATLLEPEGAAYSVGVFAWRSGDFEIQGLVPGDYQLIVRSPTGVANPGFFDARSGAVLDLRQALRAGAVRVRAGQESGPVPLAVRRSEPLP